MIKIIHFTDTDECNPSDVYCSDNTKCINLPGSYDCKCLDGYVSEADGNEYKPNPGCGKDFVSFLPLAN